MLVSINNNKVGKMFHFNGVLCKILRILKKDNKIIYDCVNFQNGERFFIDMIE